MFVLVCMWDMVSCVLCVRGGGSSELRGSGREVRSGCARRLAVQNLSYLIMSLASASFFSSAFHFLTASLAAWDPEVVGVGLRQLPKAGMWSCEPELKQLLSKMGISREELSE